MRRAQAYEALEKYEDALEGIYLDEIMFSILFSVAQREKIVINNCCFCSDYKKALELDPSQAAARQALMVHVPHHTTCSL